MEHNELKSLRSSPVEQISSGFYHSAVLGRAGRGTPAKDASIGVSPYALLLPGAHTHMHLAENCVYLGSTLLQIEQHKGLKYFLSS